MEKMTKPAKNEVPELMHEMMRASLCHEAGKEQGMRNMEMRQVESRIKGCIRGSYFCTLFSSLLYDPRAIRAPRPKPYEKKI